MNFLMRHCQSEPGHQKIVPGRNQKQSITGLDAGRRFVSIFAASVMCFYPLFGVSLIACLSRSIKLRRNTPYAMLLFVYTQTRRWLNKEFEFKNIIARHVHLAAIKCHVFVSVSPFSIFRVHTACKANAAT